MKKHALLIFAKNPVAGKVKTRLAATIGDQAALAVYQHLLRHSISVTLNLPFQKFVFYSDHIPGEDQWDDNYYFKQLQQGGDLGNRMENAFNYILNQGYEKAVIIGTDCPGLTTAILIDAFARLDTADVVLGPAEDGGYYLLGLKEMQPQLFQSIPWSTSKVLGDTINCCIESALQYSLLPVLNDVDEEKDLNSMELLS